MGSKLAQELEQDYGTQGSVAEVQPGSPDDPFSKENSQPTGEPPPAGEGTSSPEGTPAAEGASGEPSPSASTSQPVEPPVEPALAEPSTETPAEPAPSEPAAVPEITPEQAKGLTAMAEQIREEVVKQVREEEIPRIQSGLDTRIAALETERTSIQGELDEANRQIRDESIKGLTPEEQEKMREGWANEDKAKELNRYSEELDDWHTDIVALRLVQEYGQYGVTAELLNTVGDPEQGDVTAQWEVFCKDKQIEHLKANGTTNTESTEATPAPAAQQPSPAPSEPAPAGMSAQSDAGSGGVPPAPANHDDGKGAGAMGNNIAENGWQNASFPNSPR